MVLEGKGGNEGLLVEMNWLVDAFSVVESV